MVGKKTQSELKNFLLRITNEVVNNFDVDEILLFGSYAKGTENDESDIDVAVISPDLDARSPIFENAMTIIRKAKLYEPYLQLIPFNSERFYKETFVDPGFIQEIKRTGKQIYTKNKGFNFECIGN